MRLTLSEAAKAAGVARSTLYRAIEDGKLTRSADKRIDTAELVRVFGELKATGTEAGEGGPSAEQASGEQVSIAWLQELVAQQQATIDRKDRELQAAHREAAEGVERTAAMWSRKVDTLTALLPAPASTPEPVDSARPRGFFGRLFG